MNAMTDLRYLESKGAYFEGARGFFKPEWAEFPELALDSSELRMAMDAQASIFTTANAAIPALFTTMIDPQEVEILFAPMNAAKIMGGEVRKGDWTDDTIMFKLTEELGEVSGYGDFNNNAFVDVNVNFPQRQSTLYQTFFSLGEREVARYGRAGLDWAGDKKRAQIQLLDRYQNIIYFFGFSGLQNYGLLNDPSLSASLQPGPKAYNTQAHGPWVTSGVVTATANEIYTDIQSLYLELVSQSDGIITQDSPVVLAMSPGSVVALTATNSFNVNVSDLLKKNFPNIRIESAVQYTSAAGNLVQMICENIMGVKTAFPAYNEKLRAHRVVYETSSWKQKMTQGAWGTIIRRPFGIAAMLGV